MIKRLVLVLLLLTAMFGGIFGWKYFSGQKMAAMMAKPPPPATIISQPVARYEPIARRQDAAPPVARSREQPTYGSRVTSRPEPLHQARVP